ncbi:MAG: DUF5106 domain-containing protein [Bacteroidetes bacterium]|nr:DUF5106 domain-containing protein [Bacteroidota bacterium]
MKSIFTFTALLGSLCGFSQGYKVTLQAPQYKSGLVYLTYYYGPTLNIQDSAMLNTSGTAVFQKKQKLLPGVYSIVFPGKSKVYDLLIGNEQVVNINAADTNNLAGKTLVTGSKENIIFDRYQKFAAAQGEKIQKEKIAFEKSTTKADSAAHEEAYKKINEGLSLYREKVITEHPESMLAALLQCMKYPTPPHASPISKQDSLNNYQFYKKHYWDGVTFMDDRIIRSPFFIPKLERYFREVASPNPDSTIKDADYLLLLARTSPGMYQFLLNWLTDEYINPKYMGQDKIFVHLFEKYHSKGVSTWLSDKQHTIIANRAYMLMNNLVGEPAANLEMTDTAGHSSSLYNITAPYTVIVFWDPTCGHCKIEVPRLDSMYDAKWKNMGIKIFAVLSEASEKDRWLTFINEHHLQDWNNVYETDAQKKQHENDKQPSYKQLYDVIMTPTFYLLDKDKRIIAKKLSIEQMDDLIAAKNK